MLRVRSKVRVETLKEIRAKLGIKNKGSKDCNDEDVLSVEN